VVACGDVEGFVDALRRLATDLAAAARGGLENRSYVRGQYGVSAMIRRVAQVYDALLSGRAVPSRDG